MTQCKDSFRTSFTDCGEMKDFHKQLDAQTIWTRVPVNSLEFYDLSDSDVLPVSRADFPLQVSDDAIRDTAENTQLIVRVNGDCWPVRDTAYKSILDRARISGNALKKLPKSELGHVLTRCCQMYSDDGLVLIRDEKVTAIHGGGEKDYSVIPIGSLMEVIEKSLSSTFPLTDFRAGYYDHSVSIAKWSMECYTDELLADYLRLLERNGEKMLADTLVPAFTFVSSDTGLSSVKINVNLVGNRCTLNMGSCIQIEHKSKKNVGDFSNAMDCLFTRFGNTIDKLKNLFSIQLEFPVNAMARICKALHMPAAPSCEAVAMFEMVNGRMPATAHDVFMAMQEIPFICRANGMEEAKLLTISENLSRALSIDWSKYDLAKGVNL